MTMSDVLQRQVIEIYKKKPEPHSWEDAIRSWNESCEELAVWFDNQGLAESARYARRLKEKL